MITTKTINGIPEEVKPKQRCPKCKHVDNATAFVFKLPGVTICMDGHNRFYEVQYPGRAKPDRYDKMPSIGEIAAEFAKAEEEMNKPKQKPRAKKETQLKMDPV